jgi:hypothetical protein
MHAWNPLVKNNPSFVENGRNTEEYNVKDGQKYYRALIGLVIDCFYCSAVMILAALGLWHNS